MKCQRNLLVLIGACAAVGLASSARASSVAGGIVVDGTLDAAYGAPIVSQTIGTSFGDSTYTATPNGPDANGSELDAAYGTVENGTLYLMFTGDFQNNGNLVDIFIDDGRGGANILNANGGTLSAMNGSQFSTGFNPTYALDGNDYQGTFYLNTYTLYTQSPASYAGDVPLTAGIGSGVLDGIGVGLNNSNTAGVDGNSGVAVSDPSVPNAVTTGLEFGIPLSLLGNPTGSVSVMADINGGGDNYLSNQFLPGLPAGTGSLGDGTEAYSLAGTAGGFDFGADANEYFTVSVPQSLGNWTSGAGGNWSDSGNWSENAVPNGVDATANFTNPSGGAVTVDGNFTVGTLTLASPLPYIIAADESDHGITMSASSGDAMITDFQGTQDIKANLYLASNTHVTIANNGDSLYLEGDISGPGSLSSTNGGGYNASILILDGNNTYTGGTILNPGEIQLQSSTALPANSALTFNATDVPDPTLDLDGNSVTVASITSTTGPSTAGTGAIGLVIDTGGDATFTYAGDPANPSTFFGTLINNSGSGGGAISLVVASGSLTIDPSSTNTGNPVAASYTGSTTIDSGATLTLSAATNQIQSTDSNGNPTTITIIGGNTLSQSSSITNNGTLNIDDFENVAQITNNGTINIGTGGTMQLRAGSGTITYANSGLVLNGGKIDVTNNSLVLTYTAGNDPITTIRSEFAAGDFITANEATAPGTGVGYADGNTDVGTTAAANTILIRYTWLGDLNLDGEVTSSDLTTLDANLGDTNADWADGDLNYDGVVNADDVSLFMLGAAESNGANISSVPEPAGIAMLALPLLGLRRRRARVA